jgi:hypothetical protein
MSHHAAIAVTHAQVKAAAADAQSPNVAVVLLQLLQLRREIAAAAAAQWPKYRQLPCCGAGAR